MNGFHDVRFPVSIALGATGGPERINEIVLLTSGREKRNQRQAHARRRYDAGGGIRAIADIELLTEFFEARRGSLYAFRFRDPFDHRSCKLAAVPAPADQVIGIGDGATTQFSLVKSYGTGADAYVRPITKPVSGSVRLAVGGAELAEGSDFTVDDLSGVVTVVAPPSADTPITAGFQFDTPVRFDTDHLRVSLAAFEAGEALSVPLLEVFA